MFGVIDDEDEDEEGGELDFGALPEDAKLAAGALVYGMHVLVDELFQDLQTLSWSGRWRTRGRRTRAGR